jgi:polyhydroxyalkanoate synthesis regulator protein
MAAETQQFFRTYLDGINETLANKNSKLRVEMNLPYPDIPLSVAPIATIMITGYNVRKQVTLLYANSNKCHVRYMLGQEPDETQLISNADALEFASNINLMVPQC